MGIARIDEPPLPVGAVPSSTELPPNWLWRDG
jgi:hypothetical protein